MVIVFQSPRRNFQTMIAREQEHVNRGRSPDPGQAQVEGDAEQPGQGHQAEEVQHELDQHHEARVAGAEQAPE